ncbi:MAG: excalibur calcium-binding domain-containing protein [Oxalobacteraceae bacterium]|nr:MAG: excalibur calcium-binding domain-containing protein [Oxalobacteraceae bacterium]
MIPVAVALRCPTDSFILGGTVLNKKLGAALAVLLGISATSTGYATSGGLNAQGCHNDRKGGTGYHCHRGLSPRGSGTPRRSLGLLSSGGSGRAFANCSAARAAGAAPVRAGDPGYSPRLDRDGDGIGCE